jgi:thioester reductase-like protein
MSGAVLLTGATGFLGMEVLQRLVEEHDRDVIALVRAGDEREANARLDGVLRRLYATPPPAYDRVRALPADLVRDGLGLSAAHRRDVLARTSVIVHCAASIRFDLPLEEALSINVSGAERILDLGDELDRRGRLEQVVHVSTAYVSGRHDGPFAETDLDLGQRFRNTYEQSKLEAERRIRARQLPVLVARPSIIVGESTSGWTPAFNVIYWPLQAFARGLINSVPADPDGIVDIVPVDYVAGAVAALTNFSAQSDTLHLVAGERATTVAELIDLASTSLGMTAPEVVAPQTSDTIDAGDPFVPYFDVRARFDDALARERLTPLGHEVPALTSYFDALIDYARDSRWGKRPTTREAARRAAAEAAQEAAIQQVC